MQMHHRYLLLAGSLVKHFYMAWNMFEVEAFGGPTREMHECTYTCTCVTVESQVEIQTSVKHVVFAFPPFPAARLEVRF